MRVEEFLALSNLHKALKTVYHNVSPVTKTMTDETIVEAYYRNKVKQYLLFNSEKYTLGSIYKYLFITLYSQNTSDLVTLKVAKTINEEKNLDFKSEQWVAYLSENFYKHKTKYTCALRALGRLITDSLSANKMVEFEDLVCLKMVGYKTAAIIYNHFFQDHRYPVVDVNVHKAFNQFLPLYVEKTPDGVFKKLMAYQALETALDAQEGSKLANLLWYHRKICRSHRCVNASRKTAQKPASKCENCTKIELLYHKFQKTY